MLKCKLCNSHAVNPGHHGRPDYDVGVDHDLCDVCYWRTRAEKLAEADAQSKWKTIDDERVIHFWECTACGDTASVNPTFYADSGTPMCSECALNMVYVKTQIKLKPRKTKNNKKETT